MWTRQATLHYENIELLLEIDYISEYFQQKNNVEYPKLVAGTAREPHQGPNAQ